MKKADIRITITFGELLENGCWESFCLKYGVNEWCMNEGLAESTTTNEISLKDAELWGLIEEN